MRTAAMVLLVLALGSGLVSADIIHLADGTTRQGRVIEANDKEVVVDFGRGSIQLIARIPRAKVVRIEHKATKQEALMDEYVARLAKAIEGEADDWHALGAWCREQRCLNDKARLAFERAVALDPDHDGARAALGHVKIGHAWMTRERAVAVLAPTLAGDPEAKAEALAAKREAEEATTRLLEARKEAEQLKTRLAKLEDENAELRRRLAVPPPPPRERIIYRPYYIYVPRPRPKRRRPDETGTTPSGGKTDTEKKPTSSKKSK